MSNSRWRRFLPDLSQLWILAAVLVVIFAGISFFNLARDKSLAKSTLQATQTQLNQLEEQNKLLREAKAAGDAGTSIEEQARRYFGYGYKDETRVVAVPAQAQAVTPAANVAPGPAAETEAAAAQSSWLEWLKRLVQP